ncbi:hypothetical protein F0562_023938 [Nyssa sinensis]|uniref:Reverse transcriptase/retrotransposon-derived protein RNase H-like domain-containing protein n=1 Tax=Nyssa sinensis TaxID=561372 RepID=A0A5J5BJE4_9ASTE|nr:hypothetical protein F0562_023938 [Nyssa sinensis]
MSPIIDCLKKGDFVWTPTVGRAFRNIKLWMTEVPVLRLPNFMQPFKVECDASGWAMVVYSTKNATRLHTPWIVAYFWEHYPDFEDEKLYRHARLVTSAVIAKIHTIAWTVELLKTDTLLAGMRINWYGFLGKKFKDFFGHICGPILSGLVGLKRPRDHGIPYSLTEEFVSVYRMHSLLPDKLILQDINSTTSEDKSPQIQEEYFSVPFLSFVYECLIE